MDNKVGTFDRPRLDGAAIQGKLADIGCSWAQVIVRDQVTSTNDEVLDLRRQFGSSDVLVLAADEQVAGRGRLERSWSSPAGTCVAMSVAVPTQLLENLALELSALPLYVGLVVSRALEHLGCAVSIKWPNDLVTVDSDGQLHKLGGILVQLQDDVVVIGIGINVSLVEDELPIPTATSLNLLGYAVSREELIAYIVSELSGLAEGPTGNAWLDAYRTRCVTIGQRVRVTQLANEYVEGAASDVDSSGQLVVMTEGGLVSISIGDVEHVRPVQ